MEREPETTSAEIELRFRLGSRPNPQYLEIRSFLNDVADLTKDQFQKIIQLQAVNIWQAIQKLKQANNVETKKILVPKNGAQVSGLLRNGPRSQG